MDEDKFNISIRKFLKEVGVTSQRAIENAVHEAVKAGQIKAGATLKVKATLEISAVKLSHHVDGQIELD
jgi:Family of unknown function (DUF6494)